MESKMTFNKNNRAGILITATICLIVQFVFSIVAWADPVDFPELDAYIEDSMANWQVPGVAIAIVQNGEIVHQRGFGVSTVGTNEAVDEHTVFRIASVSKSFTAAAIGILVDEGKLSWDDPVTNHLPSFQTHDPYLTQALTIRDLLSHRTGLDPADLMWYRSGITRQDLMDRVRHLEPLAGLRSTLVYNNIMYTVAGQIILEKTGKTWEQFVQDEFFKPLGMTRSRTSVDDLKSMSNVAKSHIKYKGDIISLPTRSTNITAPAGGIHSSAMDIANWIKLQLAKGEFDGKRILSEKVVEEMHAPQLLITRDQPKLEHWFPETPFLSYCLGWMTFPYHGRQVLNHGGEHGGWRAEVVLIPADNVGLVILANSNKFLFPLAMSWKTTDMILGAVDRDWSTEHLEATKMMEEAIAANSGLKRIENTSPSVALEKYAGTYENQLYGVIDVSFDKGALYFDKGLLTGNVLEHWHYDTFRVQYQDLAMANIFDDVIYATFRLDKNGGIDGLALDFHGFFARKVAE